MTQKSLREILADAFDATEAEPTEIWPPERLEQWMQLRAESRGLLEPKLIDAALAWAEGAKQDSAYVEVSIPYLMKLAEQFDGINGFDQEDGNAGKQNLMRSIYDWWVMQLTMDFADKIAGKYEKKKNPGSAVLRMLVDSTYDFAATIDKRLIDACDNWAKASVT